MLKKKIVVKRAAAKSAEPVSAKPVRKSSAKAASKPKAKSASKATGKPAPKSVGRRAPNKNKGLRGASALPQAQGAFLRKRVPGPRLDLGIGAVNIEPAAEAANSTGIVAARAAIEKKATDIVVLDVREISGLCDEMVIMSARSVPHLGAVGDAVEEALRLIGERVVHTDGRRGAEPDWLLLDYGNLMVHIFRPEARAQYRLEDYYASARLVAKWKNEEN